MLQRDHKHKHFYVTCVITLHLQITITCYLQNKRKNRNTFFLLYVQNLSKHKTCHLTGWRAKYGHLGTVRSIELKIISNTSV